MTGLVYTIQILSAFFILISLIPLIRNDFWAFRVFEYPRFQKLIICLILAAASLIAGYLYGVNSLYICAAFLFLNILYLYYQVFPFTILGTKEIKRVNSIVEDNSIALMTGNVFQYNRKAKSYLSTIYKADPDLLLLLEADEWWKDAVLELEKKYPYQVLVPQENTYGMLLFSRLELKDVDVKYLVEEDIPSIQCKAVLPSGQHVQLFCMHPTPPVPQENPRSTERDKELLLVAYAAKQSSLPVIVMGDLNDVAWSYTTSLFCKISGLLDPRKGRGFFNTFHAKKWFLRFPLDHVFCSTTFKLVYIKKLASAGSDHFPMYVKLQFEKTAYIEQEEPKASEEDLELAEEKVKKQTA